MKFSKWQHPKTGAVRVYINEDFGYGVKVYAVDGGATGHYEAGFPEVVVRSNDLIGQSKVDRIMDTIDEYVKTARPSDHNPRFDDYLALAMV